jgi:GDPmannose 4,6-dehydratase
MCKIAFEYVGLQMDDHVKIDESLYRPADVDLLLGDPSKAKAKLGWETTKTLEDVICEMVDADLTRVRLANLRAES